MHKIITIQRLEIYNSYKGDIDGFLRCSKPNEKQKFGDAGTNAWYVISNKLQDMELISKRLTSPTYTEATLKGLQEICDNESFIALINKIPFYQDFQHVAKILVTIREKITPDTDTIWAGFESVEIFLKELNDDIENIQLCNFNTLDKINVEFAVTSTYQELSMTNGRSDDYLKLAAEFDIVYNRLMKASSNVINQKPWWKFW